MSDEIQLTQQNVPTTLESSIRNADENSPFLQPLTTVLLECVKPSEVVAAVLEWGVAALGANAGLVALVTRDGQEIEIVGTNGYGSHTMDKWERFSVDDPYPLSDVVRGGKSIYLGNRAEWDVKYSPLKGEVENAFQASVSLPLAARQRVFGAMQFSFATTRDFTESDQAFLNELCRQCALALERALLLEDLEQARANAEVSQTRQEFLSRASVLLAESLDYQTTLDAICHLAVPNLCDWAAVQMVNPNNENGVLLNLAIAHADPAEIEWVREAQRRYPPDMSRTDSPAVRAITTGETVFLPETPEEMLLAAARDEEHLAFIRRLDLHSYMCVPLTTQGRTLGTITFATTHASGRVFTDETVELVEELARYAVVAVENARLYEQAQREVTERKAAQEAQRKALHSLQAKSAEVTSILESVTDAFFALDESWNFTYVNAEADRALLHGRGELTGRNIWEAFPAALGSEFETQYRRAARERVTAVFQAYYPPPLDSWYDVRVYPSPTGMGLSVYFRNVTEERRREQEREHLLAEQERLLAALEAANARQKVSLERSEERFRLLVEGVQDYAIFMLDVDGTVATWNAGAQRFKGYTADEIIGQHFSRFYTPEDIERRHPWKELEIATREGRYEEEGWRVRKDGTQFWTSVVITALWGEDGELRGFAKVTRDFTERRERENQLASAKVIEQQRRFLKDILVSVTQGKLILCDDPSELPAPLSSDPVGDPIPLNARALKAVRTRVQEVAALCSMPKDSVQDLLTAASECAMNAVQHAGGGTAWLYGDADAGLVQVWVKDEGKGIDLSNLPRATLEAGFSTGGVGIGHGFSLMISTCQRVYLLTGTGGTTVVLEQTREAPVPAWLQSAG